MEDEEELYLQTLLANIANEELKICIDEVSTHTLIHEKALNKIPHIVVGTSSINIGTVNSSKHYVTNVVTFTIPTRFGDI